MPERGGFLSAVVVSAAAVAARRGKTAGFDLDRLANDMQPLEAGV